MDTNKAKRIDIKWSKLRDYLHVIFGLIGAGVVLWLVGLFIGYLVEQDEYDKTHKFVTVGQLIEPLYGDSLLEIPNYLDDEKILIFRIKYKDENQIPVEGQIRIKKKILSFVECEGDSMVIVSSLAYKKVIRDNKISGFDWIKENIDFLDKVYIYYSNFNTMRIESETKKIEADSVSVTDTLKIKRRRRAL